MITEAHLDTAITAAKQGELQGHTYYQGAWCGTACCVLGFARIAAGLPEIDRGPQPGEIVDTPRGKRIAELMWCSDPRILDVMASVQADGSVIFPDHWDGNLGLDGLTSAEGLVLPTTVEGNLGLNGLRSAKGLTLPTTIGGDLGLDGLTTAEGLTLHTFIAGNLWLSKAVRAELAARKLHG